MTKNEWYSSLAGAGYIANDQILYTIMNAIQLKTPILIEGEPGVGKTELAKAVANALGLPLLRVQFYEGITNKDLMYEYDYARQMLTTVALQSSIKSETESLTISQAQELLKKEIDIYDESFLIQRPLLSAINGQGQKVLLLDEIDKTSEETEYALLELLSDFSMSIPELGRTITCPKDQIPIVFLTSNNSRELSDALRRRCLYLYMPNKTIDELSNIIHSKAEVPEDFATGIAKKLLAIRELDLKQKPSVSEGIAWAQVLMRQFGSLDALKNPELVPSVGVIAKNKGDCETISKYLTENDHD